MKRLFYLSNISNRSNLSKKAQMEMVGLVVIVILITLGMLFLAQFALKESPEKKVFTRKGLAYSTMSSLMKTTVSAEEQCMTERRGKVFLPQIGKELIEDCAENYNSANFGPEAGGSTDGSIGGSDSFSSSNYQCRGKHSCVFVREKIVQLLNATLGSWKKNYEFKSELLRSDGQKINILGKKTIIGGQGCRKGKKDIDTSGLFPIQAGSAGLVENILYLCD